jgi:hypothetical protein
MSSIAKYSNVVVHEIKDGDEVYPYVITLSVLKFYQKECGGRIDLQLLPEIVEDLSKLETLLYYAVMMGHKHRGLPFETSKEEFSVLFDRIAPQFLADLAGPESDLVAPKESSDPEESSDAIKKN